MAGCEFLVHFIVPKQRKQKQIKVLACKEAGNYCTNQFFSIYFSRRSDHKKARFEERAECITIALFEIYKINEMTNYNDINLNCWENLAHSACYEHNQEIKSAAERVFFELIDTPDSSLIMTLVSCGSETLVFVLFSYLVKYPHKFAKNINNVAALVTCITSWQFTSFTFTRPNHTSLQKYVTRTIMSCLGSLFKILYEDSRTSSQLCQFLASMNSNLFKLYLLKSFIDAVEVIDHEMGYIKYKAMLSNFQDTMIPMICETLLPFFYRIEAGVQINQLSIMQEQLTVNDEANKQNWKPISMTNDQELETNYAFMLLESIVEFNYSITYNEFQSNSNSDICFVAFPEKVSEKIHNKQFLSALFYIIEKMSGIKESDQRHQHLEISLKCVARLVHSKLGNMSIEVKESYLFNLIQGLTRLLVKCQEIGSETLLKGIIVSNRKLYNNCDISSLKRICFKQTKNYQLYSLYIKDLFNMISFVFQRSPIKLDNQLLQQAIEMTHKLLTVFKFNEDKDLQEQSQFCSKSIKKVIESFVNNLVTPNRIFNQQNVLSITQFKSVISQFFEKFIMIGTTVFQFFFQQILEKVCLFEQGQNSIISFANMVFLLSQVVDHKYLQENIYKNQANDRSYSLLGTSVQKITKLIQEYIYARKNLTGKDSWYTDTAILIFLQEICLTFLHNFDCVNRFKIKQRLYLIMTYGELYNQYFQLEDERSEETIINYIRMTTQYLKFASELDQYEILIQYALASIQKCIFKIKWQMRRQIYLKTNILKFLIQFFEGFFYQSTHLLYVRAKVAKILVSLTFDDILDEYKFRIRRFLSILIEQPIPLIHFDLIGIFEGIETHSISKYFYRSLKKVLNLQHVFNTLYQNALNKNQEKSYFDFCQLLRTFTNNKGLRISNSIISYQAFQLTIPYLIGLLKVMNLKNSIDMKLWEISIFEILQIFRGVLQGTYINTFALDMSSKMPIFKQFTFEMIRTLILASNNFENYPDVQQNVISTCTAINKSYLQYIFRDQTQKLTQAYARLYINATSITISLMKLMMSGSKSAAEKLVKAFDCILSFLIYFNKKRLVTHQQIFTKNLEKFYKTTEQFGENPEYNKNVQFIVYLINFIVVSHRDHASFIKTIIRLLYELNKSFNDRILTVLSKLNLPQNKLLEMKYILNFVLKEDEDYFTAKMKVWINGIAIFN